MKKLLMLAAAAAAILPMTAQAGTNPTADGSVEVVTKVEDTCAISGLRNVSGDAGVTNEFIDTTGGLTTASTQPVVRFQSGVLVNPINAWAVSKTQVLKLNGFCNYRNHTVSLQSDNGGLTTSSNPTSNGTFHRRIAYEAKISGWDDSNAELAKFDTGTGAELLKTGTKTTKSRSQVVTLASNPDTHALLTITTRASTVSLVQGDYSDVLRIKLGGSF